MLTRTPEAHVNVRPCDSRRPSARRFARTASWTEVKERVWRPSPSIVSASPLSAWRAKIGHHAAGVRAVLSRPDDVVVAQDRAVDRAEVGDHPAVRLARELAGAVVGDRHAVGRGSEHRPRRRVDDLAYAGARGGAGEAQRAERVHREVALGVGHADAVLRSSEVKDAVHAVRGARARPSSGRPRSRARSEHRRAGARHCARCRPSRRGCRRRSRHGRARAARRRGASR